MIEVLTYLLFLLVGFILGRIGVKSSNVNTNTPTEIKLPNLNPINIIRSKEEKLEQEKIEEIKRINLENVNNYDGSSLGQQDFK